jgi:Peptidase family M28/PA domain
MKTFSVAAVLLAFGVAVGLATPCFAQAQTEGLTKDTSPPPPNKIYENDLRLPDDGAKLFLPDEAYLHWPLPPGEEAYADVDGMVMKRQIPDITAISRKSRDDGNQFWGRIAGTPSDRMIQDWVAGQFRAIGLEQVRRQEIDMSPLWYPNSWEASLVVGDAVTPLRTTFPITDTVGTGNKTIEAPAIWLGLGTPADFRDRDVRGKAVLLYSNPTPGGRDHFARWSGSMMRANKAGAAMVLIVMDIPGNVTTEPEAGAGTTVPTLTISMKEGTAIREAIEAGKDVTLRLRADIERKSGLKTANVWGILPGMTDENILIMAHTDAMFDGALDNASGIVMLLEIARHYATLPKEQRRRTITFVTTPDHHHGASGIKWISQNMRDFLDRTALIVNCEHPSQTQTYRLGSGLMTSTETSARRWFVGGSEALRRIVLGSMKEFGVAVYARPEGRPGGELQHIYTRAPSFHVIDHIFYHSDADTVDLVPAWGIEAVTRAYLKIIDTANKMEISELAGAKVEIAK